MYANALSNLVKNRNKEMMDVLDPRVDKFVEKFHKAIATIYNNGNGGKFAGCKRIGIAIDNVCLETLDAEELEFRVDAWILAGSDNFGEGFEMMTFWDFIDQPQEEWQCGEISGHCWSEIYDMRFLVTELEKRNFKCYVDNANGTLVVAFEV